MTMQRSLKYYAGRWQKPKNIERMIVIRFTNIQILAFYFVLWVTTDRGMLPRS